MELDLAKRLNPIPVDLKALPSEEDAVGFALAEDAFDFDPSEDELSFADLEDDKDKAVDESDAEVARFDRLVVGEAEPGVAGTEPLAFVVVGIQVEAAEVNFQVAAFEAARLEPAEVAAPAVDSGLEVCSTAAAVIVAGRTVAELADIAELEEIAELAGTAEPGNTVDNDRIRGTAGNSVGIAADTTGLYSVHRFGPEDSNSFVV